MRLDLDSAEETSNYVSIPAGTYLCSIQEIRERQTRANDPMWALRLVVAEGEFAGGTAAWDNLVFSPRGLNRVKRILKALDLPADGIIDLSTEDLLHRRAFVEVRPSEYHSPEGTVTRRNEVPYDGYRPVLDAAQPPGASPPTATRNGTADDDIPF